MGVEGKFMGHIWMKTHLEISFVGSEDGQCMQQVVEGESLQNPRERPH